jgi:tetratricopeptide (TPR) repeat protein
MAIERLQSREEQDQQLDHTRRDASPNKGRGISDLCIYQYQLLHDLQQQEVQRQREGKKIALAEGKDPSNVGEDGKPVEKQIVLSKCYDKDNPGLAGGGAEGAKKTILESFLEVSANIADIASKVAPEPVTRYALKALKTVLQMMQKNRESVVLNEKLDNLSNKDYYTASRLFNDVNYMQQPDNRKATLNDSTRLFVSTIDAVKDGFIRTASMFYAGACNDLRGEPVAAMNYFEEAYKTGREQLDQITKNMNKLCNLFKPKKRAEMEDQLQRLRQLMENFEERKKNLKERIDNYPSSSTVTQTLPLQHRIHELESINQARNQKIHKLKKRLQDIIQCLEHKSFQHEDHGNSTKRIQEYFDSGWNDLCNGLHKKARDNFSLVIALDGNHAQAYAYRGMACLELGRFEDAQADFTQALNLKEDYF